MHVDAVGPTRSGFTCRQLKSPGEKKNRAITIWSIIDTQHTYSQLVYGQHRVFFFRSSFKIHILPFYYWLLQPSNCSTKVCQVLLIWSPYQYSASMISQHTNMYSIAYRPATSNYAHTHLTARAFIYNILKRYVCCRFIKYSSLLFYDGNQ